jgi:hypothetical protein
MNTPALLAKARKTVEAARTQAAIDEKAAGIARQTARAAKAKLKQSRKLAKLAKKAARKAEDQAEESLEACERAQAKVEKLEKRLGKEEQAKGAARNGARSAPSPRSSKKRKSVSEKAGSARTRKRSSAAKTAVRPKPLQHKTEDAGRVASIAAPHAQDFGPGSIAKALPDAGDVEEVG